MRSMDPLTFDEKKKKLFSVTHATHGKWINLQSKQMEKHFYKMKKLSWYL